MFFRSFLLRLFQIILSIGAVYVLLTAGTFFLRQDTNVGLAYLIVAAGIGLGIAIVSVSIQRFDGELTLEVGRLLYPLGIFVSLVGAVFFAFHMMNQIPEVTREHYTFVVAAVLLAGFFVIRMFDLKWLRTLDEVQSPSRARRARKNG